MTDKKQCLGHRSKAYEAVEHGHAEEIWVSGLLSLRMSEELVKGEDPQ